MFKDAIDTEPVVEFMEAALAICATIQQAAVNLGLQLADLAPMLFLKAFEDVVFGNVANNQFRI